MLLREEIGSIEVTIARRAIWAASWAPAVLAAPLAMAQSAQPACTSNALALLPTLIAALAALGGICGGIVAFRNYRKAVLWKRAEFASSQLKDLNTNEELVFACRSLDWWGGLLVIPEKLRPLVSSGDADSKALRHERAALEKAMRPDLTIREMEEDKRLQVYRTAIDSLLSWLVLVRQSLDRRLYKTDDAEWIIHWLRLIRHAGFLQPFIHSFGYERDLERLYQLFQIPASDNVQQVQVIRGSANAIAINGGIARDAPSGSLDEVIAVCDDLLARFDSATDASILDQIARALVNKASALEALGRHDEAVAVYNDLLARFDSASDASILEQIARALGNSRPVTF